MSSAQRHEAEKKLEVKRGHSRYHWFNTLFVDVSVQQRRLSLHHRRRQQVDFLMMSLFQQQYKQTTCTATVHTTSPCCTKYLQIPPRCTKRNNVKWVSVIAPAQKVETVNRLECKANYSATSNNMKLVHWPLMGGLLHLVQREGDWAGPQPA